MTLVALLPLVGGPFDGDVFECDYRDVPAVLELPGPVVARALRGDCEIAWPETWATMHVYRVSADGSAMVCVGDVERRPDRLDVTGLTP